jgi:hypothetical protein
MTIRRLGAALALAVLILSTARKGTVLSVLTRRNWSAFPVALALIISIFSSSATATDNLGQGWHWGLGGVYYRLANYTLPANFQAAIDSAANKWHNQTATFWLLKGADIGNVDWSDSSTHIVWYGTPPSWCGSSSIACVRSIGTDFANKHLYDADMVFNSGMSFTNTCPWQLGSPYDIETVALHEFGHFGHIDDGTSDTTAVMWGYWNCRQTLQQHDINSMNALYNH